MDSVKTYLNDLNGVDLEPSRTRLLFKARLDHGPGNSEQLALFVGPTKCGKFDALWSQSDWATTKSALAWIPRKQLSGPTLWLTLMEAYWRGERDAYDSKRPNYNEISPDSRAIATKNS